ncbi:MAG: glycoside hydrolase family 66 protein [Mobilitalea sp.]
MNQNIKSLKIIDAFPNKAQYHRNDGIMIHIMIENRKDFTIKERLDLVVYQYQRAIINEIRDIAFVPGINKIEISFMVPEAELQGYGVDIELAEEHLGTAFDVVADWSQRPRYGFLSDFYKEDEDDCEDITSMLKYHINIVQFYDWMYKHEDLIPKEDYYVDLLERKLSRKAVIQKIIGCHDVGIKALAYGAIYATSKGFYETHKDWALYTNNEQPQNLGDWFFIMNISEESPWREHIINEFKKAIDFFDFDGIHMDTYGFPKIAYSNLGGVRKIERLNEQFPSLIEESKKALLTVKEDVSITFNAVSNWAIEEIATSEQDAVYIEVWDPQDRYFHLYQLVSRAKELSHKQVILAAYLKSYAHKEEYNNEQCHVGLLLTSATIFASGGFHFALGEKNGILPDPYYVKYEALESNDIREIRNYYDFIVRYGNLLFDLECIDNSMTHGNGGNTEYVFSNGKFSSYPQPDKVWTLIKSQQGFKIIHLINYTGIKSDIWNEGKEQRPEQLNDILIRTLVEEKVLGVYLASPDTHNGRTRELFYETYNTDRGEAIQFLIPELKVWSMIYIEVEG